MEDMIDKIKRLTLDDIIDNDPIAEGIYERFITINSSLIFPVPKRPWQ